LAKELAQTVGGKKIAYLIAILAAFVVLGSLGNSLRSQPAEAIVSAALAGDIWVDELGSAPGPDTINDPTGAGTVAPGTVRDYEVSACGDAAGVNPCVVGISAAGLTPPLQLTFTVPGTNTFNAPVFPVGPAPTCVGTGTSTMTCTYSAGVGTGAIFNLILPVVLNEGMAPA
jgi:hypothetical protein